MSYKKGIEFLLKIDTSATSTPNYVTFGGIQSVSADFEQDAADVTNYDSPGRWQEMLPGTGSKKLKLSGSGVVKDGPALDKLRATWRAGASVKMQLISPGDGTYEGPFVVPKFSLKAKHDGELPIDIDLESAGEITFTAET